MLTAVLILLVLHGLLGGADVLFNHEWRERLPSQVWARTEQALHSGRELVFALLFGSMAWLQFGGALAWTPVVLLLVEISISLRDTLLEDRTRPVSAVERTMHTLLFINFGAYSALLVPVLLEWRALPTGIAIEYRGILTWMLSALSLLALGWSVRDWLSYVLLGKREASQHAAAAAG
ncbi:MAG TPA: hypothetical protein VEC01_10995 [Noviherbaspirillum sp.]|uniref:hypothetical protein n=1 Tax=Noviherbaspirillum sp. TaxID=1926288 RepID=UPI002D394FB5|nr:hypothetical protein [Noviherbaspirillum sp.]HYD95842.1 hypothetical protein [Noviherbaspirillum sp.]